MKSSALKSLRTSPTLQGGRILRGKIPLPTLAGRPDAVPVVLDDECGRGVRVVRDVEELEVGFRDRPVLDHHGPHPREQSAPVLLPHHHDGEPPDLPRLDEGERLEELAERPETAWH